MKPLPLHVAAIIAAGGRGERFGAAGPKQLVELAGRTILERSLEAFAGSDRIRDIVLVLPPDLAAAPPVLAERHGRRVQIVAGGPRRQDSVAAGFDALPPGVDVIVVHDAARPLVTGDLIARTIDAALESGAALAALPVSDTVKRAAADGRHVDATVDRASLHLAQTPQAFRRAVLEAAIALGRGGVEATDEAALVERTGHPVRLVPGEVSNVKITTPADLIVARAFLAAGEGDGARVGVGYDLHRLVEGRPLVLGGVRIPFERGAAGHSDADALCHAVTDAVLGAVGAGDIGRHFPDTDPAWKGADSLDLLARAAGLVRAAGWRVENVDAVVILERPKLATYAAGMAQRLAGALGMAPERISVKAKTNEGVGAIGRGEAIAVHAVALVGRG